MVKSGTSYKLYLNGQLKDNLVSTTLIDQSGNPNDITIGADSQQTGTGKLHFFNGAVDDVRFYTRALSSTEIQQLYHEGGYTPLVITDIDGNKYNTVKIGTQTWMSENLKTSKYRNGESISYVSDGTTWGGLTSGAYCWQNNDIATKDTYGALYNWYCAIDSRDICPTGWHLPTDTELTTLTDYLGGATVAGGKMKEVGTTHWLTPNTGATNESGFTALPSGYKDSSGYQPLGNNGSFWSSTSYSTDLAWVRSLGFLWDYCKIDQLNKKTGLSVRCLKDN
jgi:uncharacterized protein (TIGR02145 family)